MRAETDEAQPTKDVAKGIVEREIAAQWGQVVQPGPADSSIYTVENGRSIGIDMQEPVRIGDRMYPGVQWTRADKRPGSRIAGWEQTRQMIRDAHPPGDRPRESPGLFVVGDMCPQWLRTVLALPRDEKKPDDVDTNAEDHAGDETRYRVRSSGNRLRQGRTVGMT